MENIGRNELVRKETKSIWTNRSFKISFFVVIILIIIALLHSLNFHYKKLKCRLNIYPLGLNFVVYSNDYDDLLPPLDAWNELLMQYADTPESAFHCPGSKSTGLMSDYSLNVNLSSDAGSVVELADAVFLFESVPGWNQSGNAGIFSFSNHNDGGWYNTLWYSEGYFIKPAEVDSLKWKPEKIEISK